MAFRSLDLVKQREGKEVLESRKVGLPKKKERIARRAKTQLIPVYQVSSGSLGSNGGDWSDFAGQVLVHHH